MFIRKISSVTGLSVVYVAQLFNALQDDIGETVIGVDDEGIYMMNICYQPGYHLVPVPFFDFIRMMELRLKTTSFKNTILSDGDRFNLSVSPSVTGGDDATTNS